MSESLEMRLSLVVLCQFAVIDGGIGWADPERGVDRAEWVGHRPDAATRGASLPESSQGIARRNVAGLPRPLARPRSRRRTQVRWERPLVRSPSRGREVSSSVERPFSLVSPSRRVGVAEHRTGRAWRRMATTEREYRTMQSRAIQHLQFSTRSKQLRRTHDYAQSMIPHSTSNLR